MTVKGLSITVPRCVEKVGARGYESMGDVFSV